MHKIPYSELHQTITNAFILAGVPEATATVLATVHADASRDGVYSHGLNRVETACSYIRSGAVDVRAVPTLTSSFGAVEQYDGNRGLGIPAALFAIDRAMALADQHGIGLVGLTNTSHWMRAGTYGLRAAERGYVSICWTTTEGCMPPWGGITPTLGNNPFVMAAPGPDGPILLDIAMTQYAYGKLATKKLEGAMLDYPGGFDADGRMSCDPAQILETRRLLPIGFWKGAAFAMALESLSILLTRGNPLCAIKNDDLSSAGCNQVYVAVSPRCYGEEELENLRTSISAMKASETQAGMKIHYPGEGMRSHRASSLANGVPVHEEVWERVKKLALPAKEG